MPSIEIKILNPRLGRDIPAPAYATAGAAGIDLRACENYLLPPQKIVAVKTGVAIFLRDPNLFGLLTVRSGLGRRGVAFANGVGIIDSDYQGEIVAALFNGGGEAQKIEAGERICQLLALPVLRAELKIVASFSSATARGEGGFGSTGRF